MLGWAWAAFCRRLERMFDMNSPPDNTDRPSPDANTVVGSTAAIVGILGVAAVSSASPVTGVILGLAGAGIAAGALYRKLTTAPEITIHKVDDRP
jgi:hypothetical protein